MIKKIFEWKKNIEKAQAMLFKAFSRNISKQTILKLTSRSIKAASSQRKKNRK